MENVIVKFNYPRVNTVFETGATSKTIVETLECYLNKTFEQIYEELNSCCNGFHLHQLISLTTISHCNELFKHDTQQYELTIVIYKVMGVAFTDVHYCKSDYAINKMLENKNLESISIEKVIHCNDYKFLPLNTITNFRDLN